MLFTPVVVLGIATAGRASAPLLPRAAVLGLHRRLSITAIAFLAVHIATAILDGYVNISFLNAVVPFGQACPPGPPGPVGRAGVCRVGSGADRGTGVDRGQLT